MGGATEAVYRRAEEGPARGAFVVTKSNTTVFDNIGPNPPPARSLYIGVTGDVAVTMLDDSTVTFSAVPAGMILPIVVKQVLSTGTTASGIVGLY